MKRYFAAFACLLIPLLAAAQTPDPAANHGAAGVYQSLLKLQTTASFLQVTAHPDDEDGGLLTLLSRGEGVRAGLLTLTRGEGGQNKIGPELFDELGIVRTEELLAAGRYYGVSQFFSRALDYGFSKTLTEPLQKWQFNMSDGGPIAADIVRAIRTFRPDVFSARFGGTTRDGHAHHQASSVLSRVAFLEAGDPAKFPEQIHEGLTPWQPKKMFIDNIRGTEAWTVTYDVGTYDPLLGKSYSQLAWEGLFHQKSQGVGLVHPEAGSRQVYYKRIDGTPLIKVLNAEGEIANPYGTQGTLPRETSFFEGMDETLPGIASRLGPEESKAAWLRPGLVKLAGLAEAALSHFNATRLDSSAQDIARGLELVTELTGRLANAPWKSTGKNEALFLLRIKEEQFRDALNGSLSLSFHSVVEPEKEPESPFPGFRFAVQTMRAAVPGESFPVSATLVNRSGVRIHLLRAELVAPPGWKTMLTTPPAAAELGKNESARARFDVAVAGDAPPTAQMWHRDSIEDSVYTCADPSQIGKPVPDYPLHARFTYSADGVQNTIETTVRTRQIDPLRGEIEHRLAVEPAISVTADPRVAIVPDSEIGQQTFPVELNLLNNDQRARHGTAGLNAPPGWTVTLDKPFSLAEELSAAKLSFSFSPPPETKDGTYFVHAEANGPASFTHSVELLDHPGIGQFFFLRPAQTKVVVVHTASPRGLQIGYVRGSEDAIPEVLEQMGVNLHLLTPEDLATGDLSRYQTIILGPRAYDVRDDLRASNSRLLAYVKNGGRLVVQYNQNTRAFDSGNYFPFPASFPPRNLRVVVEDSPVEMLHPHNALWNYPNRITLNDFNGWVQERSLYCLGTWSSNYTPLLSMHDPGEPPIEGSLVEASDGRGMYIFTGISWFRQLPEGVAGAVRIFVNLITPPAGK